MSSPTTLKQQLAIGDMLSLDDELLGFELDIADLMPEPTTLKRRRRTGESEDAYHKRRRNSNVCGQAKRRETLNDHIKVLGEALHELLGPGMVGERDKCSVLKGAASQLSKYGCVIHEPRAPSPQTDLALSHAALLQSFNVTWHSCNVALFIAHPNFESLDANPYLLKQLGYRAYEVMNSWDIIAPTTLKHAIGEFGKVTQGLRRSSCLQGELLHKDGVYKRWNGCVTAVESQGRKLLFGWMQPSSNEISTEALELNLARIPQLSTQFEEAAPEAIAAHLAQARDWRRTHRACSAAAH